MTEAISDDAFNLIVTEEDSNEAYYTRHFTLFDRYGDSTLTAMFSAWQAATGQEEISGVNVGHAVEPRLVGYGGGGTTGGYVPALLKQYHRQCRLRVCRVPQRESKCPHGRHQQWFPRSLSDDLTDHSAPRKAGRVSKFPLIRA